MAAISTSIYPRRPPATHGGPLPRLPTESSIRSSHHPVQLLSAPRDITRPAERRGVIRQIRRTAQRSGDGGCDLAEISLRSRSRRSCAPSLVLGMLQVLDDTRLERTIELATGPEVIGGGSRPSR